MRGEGEARPGGGMDAVDIGIKPPNPGVLTINVSGCLDGPGGRTLRTSSVRMYSYWVHTGIGGNIDSYLCLPQETSGDLRRSLRWLDRWIVGLAVGGMFLRVCHSIQYITRVYRMRYIGVDICTPPTPPRARVAADSPGLSRTLQACPGILSLERERLNV